MMERKRCESASWGRRFVLLCVVILSATVVFAGSHKVSRSLSGLTSSTAQRECHPVQPLGGILPSGSPMSSSANQHCDAPMTGGNTVDGNSMGRTNGMN
jgi:hypothetical protein